MQIRQKSSEMTTSPQNFTKFLLLCMIITFFYLLHLKRSSPRRHQVKFLEQNSCSFDDRFDLSDKIKEIELIDLNPNKYDCKIKLEDEEIVNRCKKNVLLQDRGISPLPAFLTPPPPSHTAEHDKLQLKYQRRVSEGGCSFPKGMWRKPINSRCTIVTMAEIGNYRPNDLILDWGSGCGHQATWMTRLYGVRVIGVDINGAAIRWAEKHSIGTFYYTNALNLTWIPDNTFDHFFSFAAVYYVPPSDKCRFGKEVARILKPQGTALFGWLNADMAFGFQPKSVWDCVGEIDGVKMSIYDDIDLWGSPELSNKNSYSVILKINGK